MTLPAAIIAAPIVRPVWSSARRRGWQPIMTFRLSTA